MIFFSLQAPAAKLGPLLNRKYLSAVPFPHIVLDDFLPIDFIERILNTFPDKNEASVSHTQSHQFLKRGYRPDDLKDNPCRHYLYIFNSQPFLRFLEDVTGIDGLIPDPYFVGGGLHEIESGGKLGIHTDFNFHKKLNLIRRINVLIFLNKNWKTHYGGHLELWDSEMEKCVKSIEPLFNRGVIFDTDKRSFHGHPDPLKCPENITRRSIALYYYVAPGNIENGEEINGKTDWQIRPGTEDKIQ